MGATMFKVAQREQQCLKHQGGGDDGDSWFLLKLLATTPLADSASACTGAAAGARSAAFAVAGDTADATGAGAATSKGLGVALIPSSQRVLRTEIAAPFPSSI